MTDPISEALRIATQRAEKAENEVVYLRRQIESCASHLAVIALASDLVTRAEEAERFRRVAAVIRDAKEEAGRDNAILSEMRRMVLLLDGQCTLPDGSNADTSAAHALLGDNDDE